MKHNTLIRMLALLLCLFTLLGTVACGNADGETDTTVGDNVTETEGETEYKPDIAVKNYDVCILSIQPCLSISLTL